MKKLLLFVMAFIFAGAFSSCTKINDARLNSLEKSIEKLDQNYKDYTPEKLQKQIEHCEKKFEEFDQDDVKLSDSQRYRLSKLKGKYHRTLIIIKMYSYTNNSSDGWSDVVEYINGILGWD
jgi:uncharacterized protein YeaO (DUF488 family)